MRISPSSLCRSIAGVYQILARSIWFPEEIRHCHENLVGFRFRMHLEGTHCFLIYTVFAFSMGSVWTELVSLTTSRVLKYIGEPLHFRKLFTCFLSGIGHVYSLVCPWFPQQRPSENSQIIPPTVCFRYVSGLSSSRQAGASRAGWVNWIGHRRWILQCDILGRIPTLPALGFSSPSGAYHSLVSKLSATRQCSLEKMFWGMYVPRSQPVLLLK